MLGFTNLQRLSLARTAYCIGIRRPASNSALGDYNYFQNVINKTSPDSSESSQTMQNTVDPSSVAKRGDIRGTRPSLKPSHNLAAYVRDSELLQNLVKLGVDLSSVEQGQDPSWILKMDFVKDVQPYLRFFNDIGIPGDKVGWYLTRNMNVLQESLDDLQVRVSYFQMKKFNEEAIGFIVTKCPRLLCLDTKTVDDRLGFIQKHFQLTGDEVRLVVTKQPKLITLPLDFIKDVMFHLDKFMGFSREELKQLLIAQPKLYLTPCGALKKHFNYVHNVMGISHDLIIKWPNVLRTRLSVIKTRHLFLKSISKDQFDPKKEKYVSMKALVSGRDIEFCENVANVSVDSYNTFLKTL